MPVTLVKTRWTSGNLEFLTAGGAVIATFDSANRRLSLPSGADLDLSQVLDGADAKDVANANVVGGVPVLHRVNLAAGANGDTDVVLTHKTRVVDAWLVLTGAGVASAVYTVKNGATAITDGMAASGADKALVRCATIDDAAHEIAAAGTLRVTGSGGATQPAAVVYVLGVRVA